MSKVSFWAAILAAPLICLFAYLDNIVFGYNSFLGYLYICAFEYGIYFCGVFIGYTLKMKKDKKEEYLKKIFL